MNMKKVILLSSIVALLSACGSSGNGELIGTQKRQIWNPTDPYGMVFIPQGSFNMGPSDQDVPFANVTASKTVSVGAFYMDETEITNNEYRQFVNWVRDSLAHTILGEAGIEGHLIEEDKYGNFLEPAKIDWNTKIRWNDSEVREILEEEMYLPEHERLNGRREFDTRKYVFKYQVLDVQGAANKAKREGDAPGKRDRSEILSDIEVSIFPDTLTWIHDYSYSFNDPYTKNYFWHPAFDDYPVVGINWKQAVAFTKWRTQMMNGFLRRNNEPTLPDFRLPTESEWEYASRGGLDASPYPWGGPYTKNDRGCFMANFKPLRGDYAADQALYTVEAKSFEPNDFNLYNMAGNVSEWVDSSYDPSSYEYSSSMNPNVNDVSNKRKVVRGGSWKDVSYFLQVSSRDYEYADSARSYIGFRTVQDYLGNDLDLNRPPQ